MTGFYINWCFQRLQKETNGRKWVYIKNQHFLYDLFTKSKLFKNHLWISLFTSNYVIYGFYKHPRHKMWSNDLLILQVCWAKKILVHDFAYSHVNPFHALVSFYTTSNLLDFWYFFQLRFTQKQGWTTTDRHGVIRKRATKILKHTENPFLNGFYL